MKVTLESTSKIVRLVTTQGGIEARVWEGQTESGVPVHAYVTRIAVSNERPAADLEQFQRELRECRTPSAEIAAIPARLVL